MEFDVRFEEAAVVEGAHVISARLVVEGDDPESLENWLAVGLGSPDSFDFQDQPIQFELGFFRLHQHERFPWSTQQAGSPTHLPAKKPSFFIAARCASRSGVRGS